MKENFAIHMKYLLYILISLCLSVKTFSQQTGYPYTAGQRPILYTWTLLDTARFSSSHKSAYAKLATIIYYDSLNQTFYIISDSGKTDNINKDVIAIVSDTVKIPKSLKVKTAFIDSIRIEEGASLYYNKDSARLSIQVDLINKQALWINNIDTVRILKNTTNWQLNNANLKELNALNFNDPGRNEGLNWLGAQMQGWRIHVADDSMNNEAGEGSPFIYNLWLYSDTAGTNRKSKVGRIILATRTSIQDSVDLSANDSAFMVKVGAHFTKGVKFDEIISVPMLHMLQIGLRDTTEPLFFDTTFAFRKQVLQPRKHNVLKYLSPNSFVDSNGFVRIKLPSDTTTDVVAMVGSLADISDSNFIAERLITKPFYLRPNEDISNLDTFSVRPFCGDPVYLSFQNNTGGDILYSYINETTPSDVNYIRHNANFCSFPYASIGMSDTAIAGIYLDTIQINLRIKTEDGDSIVVMTLDSNTIVRRDTFETPSSWVNFSFSFHRNILTRGFNNLRFAFSTPSFKNTNDVSVSFLEAVLKEDEATSYFTFGVTDTVKLGYYDTTNFTVKFRAKTEGNSTLRWVVYDSVTAKDSATFSNLTTSFSLYSFTFAKSKISKLNNLRLRVRRVQGSLISISYVVINTTPLIVLNKLPYQSGILADSGEVFDSIAIVQQDRDTLQWDATKKNLADTSLTLRARITTEIADSLDEYLDSLIAARKTYVNARIHDGLGGYLDSLAAASKVYVKAIIHDSLGRFDSLTVRTRIHDSLSSHNQELVSLNAIDTDILLAKDGANKVKSSPIKRVSDTTVSVNAMKTNRVNFNPTDSTSSDVGDIFRTGVDIYARLPAGIYSLTTSEFSPIVTMDPTINGLKSDDTVARRNKEATTKMIVHNSYIDFQQAMPTADMYSFFDVEIQGRRKQTSGKTYYGKKIQGNARPHFTIYVGLAATRDTLARFIRSGESDSVKIIASTKLLPDDKLEDHWIFPLYYNYENPNQGSGSDSCLNCGTNWNRNDTSRFMVNDTSSALSSPGLRWLDWEMRFKIVILSKDKDGKETFSVASNQFTNVNSIRGDPTGYDSVSSTTYKTFLSGTKIGKFEYDTLYNKLRWLRPFLKWDYTYAGAYNMKFIDEITSFKITPGVGLVLQEDTAVYSEYTERVLNQSNNEYVTANIAPMENSLVITPKESPYVNDWIDTTDSEIATKTWVRTEILNTVPQLADSVVDEPYKVFRAYIIGTANSLDISILKNTLADVVETTRQGEGTYQIEFLGDPDPELNSLDVFVTLTIENTTPKILSYRILDNTRIRVYSYDRGLVLSDVFTGLIEIRKR